MIKRGQIKLSFGMIFSIILMIVFIAFVFYAVRKFLNVQDEIKIAQFVSGLQSDVDRVWASSQGSQQVEYALPKKIEQVCFKDDDYENMIFRPSKFASAREIKHLDIGRITARENPFCLENVEGKVNMILQKEFNEDLVNILND